MPVQPLTNDNNFDSRAEKIDQSDFSFENVKKIGIVVGANYSGRYDTASKVCVLKRKEEKQSIQGNAVRCGWKFHISLESSEKNIEHAWDVLLPVLRKYKINLFKLLPPREGENTFHPDYTGREGTIYAYREVLTLEQWRELLQEIENTLTDNNIEPGCFSTKCQSVSGSRFFSYRFDGDNQGNYVAVRQAEGYKPDDIIDPFYEKLVIQTQTPNMKNN